MLIMKITDQKSHIRFFRKNQYVFGVCMATKTIYAIIKGQVQGVFFREYTRKEAINLGLKGWVRNRPDGSVEALLSGDSETVDRMLTWLHHGSPMARVDLIHTEKRDAQESFSTIDIRY